MNDAIRPQPGILDIALYEGGKAGLVGVSNIVKLSSNENPFGPSGKAKEAFARSVHQLHRYPPTDHASLRAAIADVHGLDAGRVICGVGSDEIITLLCQAYAGPKDEVVFTEHGFLMYKISAMAAGATPVEVAERERTTDVDALLDYRARAPHAVRAHPSEEHFLPLLVAQGATTDADALRVLPGGNCHDVAVVLFGPIHHDLIVVRTRTCGRRR